MWNVYLPLLGYRHVSGPAGAKLVPYLATSLPRISRDRRTYRLTLRDGLRYSDGDAGQGERLQGDDRAGLQARLRRRRLLPEHRRRGGLREAAAPKGGIRGIDVDNATGSIVIHLKEPQADFSNVLASEFAAPVPADSPATDTSLHPLPATGPYEIKSYQPKVADRRGAQPELPGLALPRRRAGRQSRPRHLGHRPERFGRAPPRTDRQGRLDELLPGARQAAAGDRAEAREPPALLHAAEPHVLLHEHAGAAVHEPQGAAGRELRDLAALAEATSPAVSPTRRENILPPGYPSFQAHSLYRHDLRKAIRLVRESGYWHWEAGHRLEPRRRRRPAVHASTSSRC